MMNKGFISFFERPGVLKWSAILATICGFAACVLFCIIDGQPAQQHVIYVMIALGVLFLYRSYLAHDKNVMKGLLGVVLAAMLFNELAYLYNVFIPVLYRDVAAEDPSWGLLYAAVEVIFLLIQASIVINHFVINSDHHSSPAKVQFNQLLFVTMMMAILLQEIVHLVTLKEMTVLAVIGQVVWFLLEVCAYNTVICIESKLDAYRILREANGWEEKG